jgi:hypothetical protein
LKTGSCGFREILEIPAGMHNLEAPLPTNDLPKLNKASIKRVQKNIGSILYYALVVDMTVLMALTSITVEQTKATKKQWPGASNYLIISQAKLMQRYDTMLWI